jgi:hypothetical protein
MKQSYLQQIKENTYIKIFCLYSSSCSGCPDWINNTLIPSVNGLDIFLIDMENDFILFRPKISPTTYIYIVNKKDPIIFDGFVLKEGIIGYVNTAIDIYKQKVVSI